MAFCANCGTKVNSAFCPICGTPGAVTVSPGVAESSATSDSPTIAQTAVADNSFRQTYGAIPTPQLPGNNISPRLIGQWNWGAFLLPAFWPFTHGVAWLGVVTILCAAFAFLVFPGLISLGIAIYLGIKGNEIAVSHRLYANDAEFTATESAWTRWGVGIIILSVVLGVLFAIIGAVLSSAGSSSY